MIETMLELDSLEVMECPLAIGRQHSIPMEFGHSEALLDYARRVPGRFAISNSDYGNSLVIHGAAIGFLALNQLAEVVPTISPVTRLIVGSNDNYACHYGIPAGTTLKYVDTMSRLSTREFSSAIMQFILTLRLTNKLVDFSHGNIVMGVAICLRSPPSHNSVIFAGDYCVNYGEALLMLTNYGNGCAVARTKTTKVDRFLNSIVVDENCGRYESKSNPVSDVFIFLQSLGDSLPRQSQDIVDKLRIMLFRHIRVAEGKTSVIVPNQNMDTILEAALQIPELANVCRSCDFFHLIDNGHLIKEIATDCPLPSIELRLRPLTLRELVHFIATRYEAFVVVEADSITVKPFGSAGSLPAVVACGDKQYTLGDPELFRVLEENPYLVSVRTRIVIGLRQPFDEAYAIIRNQIDRAMNLSSSVPPFEVAKMLKILILSSSENAVSNYYVTTMAKLNIDEKNAINRIHKTV